MNNENQPITLGVMRELLKDLATKDDLAAEEKRLNERVVGFATKDDLKRFATKEDLERFATKEDLEENNAKLMGQVTGYLDKRLDERLIPVERKLDRVIATLDGLARRVTDDEVERAALQRSDERQTQWIKQLATGTGTTLEPAP